METADVLQTMVEFIPVIFFSVMAFRILHPVLFMLAAGTALFSGFYWFDTYDTTYSLAVSLCMIIYSLVCLGFAYRYMFRRGEE